MAFGHAMNLSFHPIRECDVHEMTRWTYDPPYDVYNLSHPPDEAAVAYWLDPSNGVHAIFDAVGCMVGYCTFGVDGQVPGGDYSADALDIGLALRPDQTGRGLGAVFTECVIDFAQRTYAPPLLRVTIATFNERAQRVWLRCGFEPVESFMATHTEKAFVVLSRRAPGSIGPELEGAR